MKFLDNTRSHMANKLIPGGERVVEFVTTTGYYDEGIHGYREFMGESLSRICTTGYSTGAINSDSIVIPGVIVPKEIAEYCEPSENFMILYMDKMESRLEDCTEKVSIDETYGKDFILICSNPNEGLENVPAGTIIPYSFATAMRGKVNFCTPEGEKREVIVLDWQQEGYGSKFYFDGEKSGLSCMNYGKQYWLEIA